jgi:hypothetical protein
MNRFYLSGALIFWLVAGAAAQSGGPFTIERSVIAGGGQLSAGGQFSLATTAAQAVAGQRAATAAGAIHAGFWNPDQFVPTASEVTVGGRVTTAGGGGIRNVIVTMTSTNGETRTALSGTFGYFRFTNVPAGAAYVFSVSAKRYRFGAPTQIHTVVEDIDSIYFVANGD